MTKALLLAASTLLLGAQQSGATASTPTSYIDIHLITSFTSTGSLETGYLFRIPASGSTFAGSPPKAPEWATHTALTGGASSGSGKNPNDIHAMTSNLKGSHPSHRLMIPPESDGFLCNESKGKSDYTNPTGNGASAVFDPDTQKSGFEESYILVPRGHCTFEAKARSAQRLGASGVIVRNTLDSRYGLMNETADTLDTTTGVPHWANTEWPAEQRDYECGTNKAANHFGMRAEVDASKFDFNPAPYDGTMNNPYLTGPAVDGNLCAQTSLDFEKHCPSERCLLTGRNATSDDGTTKLEACCAWDMHLRMSSDGDNDGDAVPQEQEEKITIPALYVTMEKGEDLYDVVMDAERNNGSGGTSVQFVNIVPYARWYPSVHYSSIIVWALAVFTLWIACYESAKEYRNSWKKISKAVNDGVLVFQRSGTGANATGRERAETEDTVDVDDENLGELELVPEVEMTNQAVVADGSATGENGGTASPLVDTDFGAAPASPFSISDDANEMDDFVGNPPPSPKPEEIGTSNGGGGEESMTNEGAPMGSEEQHSPPRGAFNDSSAAASPSTQPQQQQAQRVNLQSRSTTAAAENMELNAFHAVMFVLLASAMLFILFFFNLYKVVRVIYGLAGSVAMNQIMIYPAYNLLATKYLGGGLSSKLQSNAFGDLPGCRGVYFKWIDIASTVTAWSLGIAWLIVGFSYVQPMNNVYYWLIQDVMGVCFCILILGVVHINTIMVASVLLSLVFIYDVFYVFISPFIFGSSVMIDVATGGAGGVDPYFCEKYPSDSRCRGILAPLPMLLGIPHFNDFRGGFSMLGLGDIILPGLLISFAARYDAARALVRKCSQTSSIRGGENAADAETDAVGETSESSSRASRYHYHLGRVLKAVFNGYFGPLMIAYGVGLMVAYIAVWTTKRGQPALLYLVPACLGTMFFLGWRRRELSELWSGPKVMKKANRMVGVASKIPAVRAARTREAGENLAETTTMV